MEHFIDIVSEHWNYIFSSEYLCWLVLCLADITKSLGKWKEQYHGDIKNNSFGI